jgi:secreted protein with Ig-like and vWFA domain
MPVNPVVRPAEAWRDAADPLVQQIQSGPTVTVLVPDDANGEEPPPTVRAADG